MEKNFQPKNFQTKDADEILNRKIKQLREKREKMEAAASNGEEKSEPQLGDDIELVPAENEPQKERVVPVSFEPGGNATEDDFEVAEAGNGRSSTGRELDGLIKEGKEIKAGLEKKIAEEQDEEKRRKLETELEKADGLLRKMTESQREKDEEKRPDDQSAESQMKINQGDKKVEVIDQNESTEKKREVFFNDLDDLKSFATKKELESKLSLEQSLERAMEALNNEQGIVELKNSDVPTIVISDLHARREFLAGVLEQKNKNGETVFELLKKSKVNVVCVGDGMHSEREESWDSKIAPYHLEKLKKELGGGIANPLEGYKRMLEKETNKKYGELTPFEIKKAKETPELKAKWAELEPELRRAMMENEMVKSLGTMKMVMELKAQFPDSFHYTRGNHDDVDERISGFAKYSDESSEVKGWIRNNYGQDFLDNYAQFEQSLPLMVKNGNKLVVTHAAPGDIYEKDQLLGRDKKTTKGLTWTDNNKGETSEEKIDGTLKNIDAKGAVWIIGHRPVAGGNFRQQFNGKLVQINNGDEHVIAVMNSDGSFDPQSNVHKLSETGGTLAELEMISKVQQPEDQEKEQESNANIGKEVVPAGEPVEVIDNPEIIEEDGTDYGPEIEMKQNLEGTYEQANENGNNSSEGKGFSAEQLRKEVEDLHLKHLEAQRSYWRVKNEMGMIKKMRLKLKLGSDEELEEYRELKKRLNDSKILLDGAELEFKNAHQEFSGKLVAEERKRLLKNMNQASGVDMKEKDQKNKDNQLQEALRKFVVSEKIIDFKILKKDENGQEEEVTEKISLLEDLNKKFLALNQTRMEVMSEKDRNLALKCWESYRKLPKKYKIILGTVMAGTIAAGAAFVGGASATAIAGVSALSMGRRTISSIAGSVFGAYVYKKSKDKFQAEREEDAGIGEIKMAEKIAEGRDVDLYSLMKDRLAQEKKDNYKSLALAGAAGFTTGAGFRGFFGMADFFDVSKPDISQVETDDFSESAQSGQDNGLAKKGAEIAEKEKPGGRGAKPEAVSESRERQAVQEKSVKQKPIDPEKEAPQKKVAQEPEEKSKKIEKKEEVQQKSKHEIDDQEPDETQLTAEEYVKGVQMIRKSGRMPGIMQDREYVVASRSAKMGLNYVPKQKLPDDIVEKILSEREKPAEVQISPEEAEKLTGNEPKERMTPEQYRELMNTPLESEELTGKEPQSRMTPEEYQEFQSKIAADQEANEKLAGTEQQDRMTQDEYLAQQKDFKEIGALAGKETSDRMTPEEYQEFQSKIAADQEANEKLAGTEQNDRMTPEEYRAQQKDFKETEVLAGKEMRDRMSKEDYLAFQGAGEEYGGGYDADLLDENIDHAVGEEEGESFGKKVDEAIEKGDFEFQLAKGDTVWSRLEERFGGDQQKVAEAINQFRKEVAKGLIEEYGYSPKDAQNYIHWRFRNLQPGDSVVFEGGKLQMANFVDQGRTDYFAKKFEIQTSQEPDKFENLAEKNDKLELAETSKSKDEVV